MYDAFMDNRITQYLDNAQSMGVPVENKYARFQQSLDSMTNDPMDRMQEMSRIYAATAKPPSYKFR